LKARLKFRYMYDTEEWRSSGKVEPVQTSAMQPEGARLGGKTGERFLEIVKDVDQLLEMRK
jgi:hypothetical protein